MNLKSYIAVFGVVAALSISDANSAEARGFGFRGGASLRVGIGGNRSRNIRYYGPSFSLNPRAYGASRQGMNQLQQRPWYYSRSGPIEYYRPVNPLYRTR